MARSLSLTAYRALSWGGQHTHGDMHAARPDGQLVWFHATTPERLSALQDLSGRLLQQRPELNVLFTRPPASETRRWPRHLLGAIELPQDHPAATRDFMRHWHPDVCIWTGGSLQPNLIGQASEQQIPMILLGAVENELHLRRHRWLPDLLRTTLDCFDMILADSEASARYVRRSGISSGKVSVSSALQVSPNPRPWPEEELVETNQALAGRPVWLSAWSQDSEFISILIAHRHALRFLHRLLLVLHVADPAEADPLKARLKAMDLRCADWDAGDEIEDSTQVVLSTVAEDLELWYRVAPVTFLGSSLEPGAGGQNPLTAVSLGSAVLYGSHVQGHIDTYARLAAAGAARAVRNADALGAGVVQLLAPDQAASVALAGWQVVTEGAHLTDQLIDLIQNKLDKQDQ
ncbi:3-deoxy-D-manno-octulosonic acid transferase [Tropicibacter sp. R16_0]|uniref:3-deoxy-D-manno-octulosonic acid transferase n=1 Tax=Tropicibacter sp. R16_0 TaxID=2821102 RepID=UPI001ADCC869|nr:glycosyltransferase N-terminal domain-containing protein [Tropicibacter sp. R16_0]MBO9450580.1 3-deoxy-D-manno-octulosonic acid transferase [Tropicibacter sp. R16_0]